MVHERVLILDRDSQAREALGDCLSSLEYPLELCEKEDDAIRLCAKEKFAVAFVDAVTSSFEATSPIERILAVSPLTPVIMMSAKPSTQEIVKALRAGAMDFLTKPIDLDDLSGALGRCLARRQELVRVQQQQRALEMKIEHRTRELSEIYQETIKALGSALDTRDPETQEHAHRVVHYTMQIAEAMGLSELHLMGMERGAILHDVGKIGVPDGILFKPGRLTSSEWACMKTHTEIGYNMLDQIRFLRDTTPIVRSHHERFDGKGYPDSLLGKQIPVGARIFAIADAVDAMTSDRPYSRARSMEEATEEVIKCSGSQFDPAIVNVFQQLVQRGNWAVFSPEERVEAESAAAIEPPSIRASRIAAA